MASRNVSGRLSVNLVFTVAFADLKPYLSLPPHRATDKKEDSDRTSLCPVAEGSFNFSPIFRQPGCLDQAG